MAIATYFGQISDSLSLLSETLRERLRIAKGEASPTVQVRQRDAPRTQEAVVPTISASPNFLLNVSN